MSDAAQPAPQPQAVQLPLKNFTPPAHGEGIVFREVTYFIGAEIGRGGFGVVHESTDSWGNELAAKVLLPRQQPYEVIRENWAKELEALVTFRHPFVTHIFAAFEYRDTFYLITERCHDTLTNLFTIESYNGFMWIMPIARCVLQALHFLHGAGVVHKDLHPGNVFMSIIKDEIVPDQYNAMRFKVGDLGISKVIENIDAMNTLLAEWMLPPEAIAPTEYGKLDHRVDIYHCGLLFLQVLYGRTLNLTREQVLEGVPRQMAESLPPPFNFALAKALRRHVTYRTASAMEFWRDLQHPNQANPDQASEVTSESTPGAGSSAPQD
jgi:serine/threonine protein kinase